MKIEGLYQRKGVYWYRKTTNGRRVAVSLQTKDFAEAVSKAVEMKDEMGKEADTTILSSAIAQFLRVKVIRRAPTLASYQTALGKLVNGDDRRSVRSVSAQWLEARVAELEIKQYAPTSINQWMGVWQVFFNWCRREKLLKTSPAERLEYRDEGSRIRDTKACTVEQRNKMIDEAEDDDLRFILYAGFHAGFRKLEIIEARRDWFDLDLKMIHVKRAEGKRLRPGEKAFKIKDGTERKLPLSDAFHVFLSEYLKGKEPLDFVLRPGVKHGSWEYRTDIHREFHKHVKKVGPAWVTPHCMRHTFATLLITQRKMSLDIVAFWLGDTPDTTRKHYAHLVNYDASINI